MRIDKGKSAIPLGRPAECLTRFSGITYDPSCPVIPVMSARFMLCVSLLGLGVLHMATDRATEVEPTVVCRHMILRPCVSS